MRTDLDIERNVRSELHWSADIDATDVALNVREGVVTLRGFARSGFEKTEIERVAKRVTGVLGVANELAIRESADIPTDSDIAREVVRMLEGELPHLARSVKILVTRGHVTLEGNTQHEYLREQAERLLRRVSGVTGITNRIVVKPGAETQDIQSGIEEAFRRNAEVDGNSVKVTADGGVVTLAGEVRSWFERQEAERAAAAAPGVIEVKNNIVVRP